MELQLPTVTVDDLHNFHAKHFPHAPIPEPILHCVENEPAETCCEEGDGELGYYEDGTPRTLTDEQVAMFRHSEIQGIIRKRRQQRDNDDGSDEGEAESFAKDSAKVGSPASQPTATTISEAGKVLCGRVEKLKSQQWVTSSPRTKAKNKRNRDRYKAKKRDERLKRELSRKNDRDEDEDEESDEWDPWHQAKGPDAQKDHMVDLDY